MFKRMASVLILVAAVSGFTIPVEALQRERPSDWVGTVDASGGTSQIGKLWTALARLLGLEGEQARPNEDPQNPRSLWGADEGNGHHDPHG